jgi:hypothetical protein
MSQRDYRLVIRLDIDKQSLTNLAEKLNEVVQKAFGKIPKQIGGVGRVVSVADGRTITLLTKIANEVSVLNGNISRLIRVSRRMGVRKSESKEDEDEEEEEGSRGIFSIIGRVFRKGGGVAGLGAFGAVIGIFSAIGEKIIELLEALVRKGAEFSGVFKSTFKLLDVGISLLLKPIADIFGLLFRPLARLLLPVALALNKFLEPFIKDALRAIDKLFGKGEPEGGAKFFTPEGEPIGTVGKIDLGDISEALKREIKEKIEGLLLTIQIFAGPTIIGMLAGIGRWLWKLITDAAGIPILDAFANIEKWLEDNFGVKIKTLFQGGVMGPISSLVSWISENWGNVEKWLGGAWDGLVKWFEGVKEGIGKTLGPVWDNLSKAFDNIKDTVSKTLEPVWDKIKEVFGGAWDTLTKILSPVWDTIKDVFGSVKKILDETFKPVWDTIKNTFEDIKKKIIDVISPSWESLVKFFSRLGSIVSKLLARDFVGAIQELSEMWRGQFGLTVPRAGQYFLEAGELVLSRADVMRLLSALGSIGGGNTVNVAVTVTGPIYGVSDLEDRIRGVVHREVGNMLYDIQRRGVR